MMNNNYMSFSNYDFSLDAIPQYIEKGSKRGWINWGKNNLYPTYLISLCNRSPLHSAIVDLKASMIGKNGWNNLNYNSDTIIFLRNAANEDDLNQILGRISTDLVIFGGFCLNIRWNKERTKIAEINYISPDSVRIAEPTETDEPESYLISEDWKNPNKYTPVRYPGFSTVNREEASQILYYKEHRSSNNWYPVPEYLAGVNLIETNYKINEFHLHNINNEFSPSMHINFNYMPQSDEEREQLVKRLKAEYEGVKKSGNVIISFTETPDKKPTIEPITLNDSDNRFIELKKDVMDGIISAHRLNDKKLLGLEISGELGGHTNELLESLSVFQAQYVCVKQKQIEGVFNMLARINGISNLLTIERYAVNLQPNLPIGDLLQLLTAQITDLQKISILESKGYSRTEASNLVQNKNNA